MYILGRPFTFSLKSFHQVREHAAAVLAGLMKGGDEDLATDFRDRAYREANIVHKRRKSRLGYCLPLVPRKSSYFFTEMDLKASLRPGSFF